MKMDTFLVALKVKKSDTDRMGYIKSHIIKDKYVPLEEKQTYAQNIIKSSYYRKRDDGTEEFYVNSVAKYMLTAMTYFDIYTDLERSKKDGKILEEFNTLNQAGIFDVLIQNMDQRELKEFNMVLDMVEKDMYQNEYELHGFIKHQVERFGNLVGTTLLPFLENLDVAQIEEVVKKYVTK